MMGEFENHRKDQSVTTTTYHNNNAKTGGDYGVKCTAEVAKYLFVVK